MNKILKKFKDVSLGNLFATKGCKHTYVKTEERNTANSTIVNAICLTGRDVGSSIFVEDDTEVILVKPRRYLENKGNK